MLGFLGDAVDQFKNMPTAAKIAVVGALAIGGFLTYRALAGQAGGGGAGSSGGGSIPIDLASPTPADQIWANGGQPIGASGGTASAAGLPVSPGSQPGGSTSGTTGATPPGGSFPTAGTGGTGSTSARQPTPAGGEVHPTHHFAHPAHTAHIAQTANSAHKAAHGHPAIKYGTGSIPGYTGYGANVYRPPTTQPSQPQTGSTGLIAANQAAGNAVGQFVGTASSQLGSGVHWLLFGS